MPPPPRKSSNITIMTFGGLCNRLLALSSALALGHQLQKQVQFVWQSNNALNAPFDSLFEIIDNRLRVAPTIPAILIPYALPYKPESGRAYKIQTTHELKIFLKHKVKKLLSAITRFDISFYGITELSELAIVQMSKHKRIGISSWAYFYPTKLADLSYLRPIKPIQAKIDLMKRKMHTNHLTGVHIRRGDRIQLPANNQTATFVTQMQQQLDNDSALQFFVASDSKQDKQYLKQIFGERVITYDAQLSRNNIQGMQDAVVELYLLGAGNNIIGSSGSTYSRQAAMLHNIPLYRVSGDNAPKFEQLHRFDQATFQALVNPLHQQ